MNSREVVKKPIVSERSYELIELNRYTFEVDKRACKQEIAAAIEDIFKVTVIKVNTMNVPGKARRVRQVKGMTPSWKKAIVTIKEGDSIEFFEGR